MDLLLYSYHSSFFFKAFCKATQSFYCYVLRVSQFYCVAPVRSTLQKQHTLPVRPIIPLVARISDQNASGAPPMTVREKSRLDKFKQLLASPNTDLGR